MSKAEKPTIEERTGHPLNDVVYRHPAFGCITMTIGQGGKRSQLFGSDIGHSQVVRIAVHRAQLHRELSRDWTFARDVLVEFEMSHAQFAEFITSVGNGTGTPVTLRCIREGEMVDLPDIEKIESKHDTLKAEIQTAAKERLAKAGEAIAKLDEIVASGKIGKKELRGVVEDLKREIFYLPGSIGFVVDQAKEALETATTHAKVEIEAYIAHAMKSAGLAALTGQNKEPNIEVLHADPCPGCPEG